MNVTLQNSVTKQNMTALMMPAPVLPSLMKIIEKIKDRMIAHTPKHKRTVGNTSPVAFCGNILLAFLLVCVINVVSVSVVFLHRVSALFLITVCFLSPLSWLVNGCY